jgi:hypothetical protein
MAASPLAWLGRHRSRALGGAVVLLLIVVAVQSQILYGRRASVSTTDARSASTSAPGDTTRAATTGVFIRMHNVRFTWSRRVFINTGNMAVRAVPLQGSTIDFDDPESFRLTLQQSVVLISPDVLEGMFNESLFNYHGSKLHDLKVRLEQEDNQNVLHVKGKVNMGLWLPFSLNANVLVDTTTNTLVIDVSHLKILGFLSATKLIKWKPLRLENLITLPPNKSLMIEGNRMRVKPFGLFPPPRVDGTMESIAVGEKEIRLVFSGGPIPAPEASGDNYVYLKGGTSQFGQFRMLDTDILILDQEPADPFAFSLVHYAEMIPKSKIELHDTKSVRVTMPDY